MHISFESGRSQLPAPPIRDFVSGMSRRLAISPEEVVSAAEGDSAILKVGDAQVDSAIFWPFVRFAYEKRLLDLLPANGLPSVNYDLMDDIGLDRTPFGLTADFSRLKLDRRPAKIAGCSVDFPLGVPASILTTNASYLKYYADRGYCILTYKTVRPAEHKGNMFPQWVCIKDPIQFDAKASGELIKFPPFKGRTEFFPQNPMHGTMANSFGVPSYGPSQWQPDLARAREFVREGHQVLIVSVMPPVGDAELSQMAEDFAKTAVLAKQVGADIIELNYSCPNTRGERAGLIFETPQDAAEVSRTVRKALGADTPIFTKIGYLSDEKLQKFVDLNWKYIDGIVAINTISAPVVDEANNPIFPGRVQAGISGWSVKKVAHRLAGKLVAIRNELAQREGKHLTLLGLGGIMTKSDYQARLSTGVDAAEICTGAYFNPFLGLEIRNAQGSIEVEVTRDTNNKSHTAIVGAPGRSEKAGAIRPSEKGGTPVSARVSDSQTGIIDPARLRKAFEEYFEETPIESIVDELDDCCPELLVHLAAKHK